MAGEEKLYIKENLMKLVASGTRPILLEQNHIKDALAKIIVELIKVRYIQ
jgi:exportin-5